MVTRSSIGVPFIIASALLGLMAPVARADEAYLCGPDTVVYVKIEELELKKRTDKCIAAYYGLTVANDSADQPGTVPTSAEGAPAKPGTPPELELKSLSDPEYSVRGTAKPERSASLLPAAASPGTDFRNVHIINAVSGESSWFKHNR